MLFSNLYIKCVTSKDGQPCFGRLSAFPNVCFRISQSTLKSSEIVLYNLRGVLHVYSHLSLQNFRKLSAGVEFLRIFFVYACRDAYKYFNVRFCQKIKKHNAIFLILPSGPRLYLHVSLKSAKAKLKKKNVAQIKVEYLCNLKHCFFIFTIYTCFES